MTGQGAVYDLLCEEGYVQGGKVGTPVDSIAHATALAVAIGLKRGASLDVVKNALTKLDDFS